MSEHWGQLSLRNETANLSRVRTFVGDILGRLDLSPNTCYQMILAVDEAVANIMEHAYENGAAGPIHLNVKADSERVTFRFVDFGRSFDPDQVAQPDLSEHFRAGKRKGLGIHLIRKIMDEVHYEFGDYNALLLVKYLGQRGAPEKNERAEEDYV